MATKETSLQLDALVRARVDLSTELALRDMAAACGMSPGALVRGLIHDAVAQWYGDEPTPKTTETAHELRNVTADRIRFAQLPESMQAAINAAGLDETARRRASAAIAARTRWGS